MQCDALAASLLNGILPTTSFSLTMVFFHVAHVSAPICKWICKCPDAIGPIHDMPSDEEFYTPPPTPLCVVKKQHVATIFAFAPILMPKTLAVHRPLSPAQSARLMRRHAHAVQQLTTPPPIVMPPPPGPLKAYQ